MESKDGPLTMTEEEDEEPTTDDSLQTVADDESPFRDPAVDETYYSDDETEVRIIELDLGDDH